MKPLVTKGTRILTVLLLISLTTGASAFSQVPVSLPNVNLNPGETTTVPVEVGDVSDEEIASFNFTITYDPSLVDVTAIRSGLSSDPDASFEVNNPSEGELSVAVAASNPLDGSGSLVDLEITAASDAAGSTDLSFSSFQFQEGTPAASTTDGSAEVKDVFVSLPDITARTGEQVEIDVEVSDLSNLGARSFQFDLPFDPSVLNDIEVLQEGTLSADMNFQSTVSGGEISVAAAQSDALQGSGTLVTIQATLMTGSTPLEFSSIQFNEGRISTGTDPGSVQAADVIATFPDFPAAVGTSQSFAVRTTDLTGLDALSYEFTLEFDPSVINVTGLSTEGTLSEGIQNTDITVNGDSAVVAVAASSPIEGEGALIEIETEIVGAGESPLRARSFQFNEGSPSVATVPGSITATAESSPSQFIHNAADPGASSVDVYFGDRKVLDDFGFRTATEFLPVPADATFDVGVAPASSSGPGDIIARFPAEFSSGTSHTVVANGVLNPQSFAENPDGESIAFEFFIEPGADSSAADGEVDLRAVHGATDAPTIDIDENGTTLLDDLTYGDVTSDYLSATAEEKRLLITPGESADVVAAFDADLSGLGGTAVTVLASGFLDPSANQDGQPLALVAVLPNGEVVVFEQNRPPEITAVPSGSVTPTQTFDGQVEANDPDGDPLSYSLEADPENASIDDSGAFTFTPPFSQRGSEASFTVRVSDGVASTDSSFAITVEDIDRQPISVDITKTFQDATVQTNYLLVGLPGQVQLPIAQTLQGEAGENNQWRAFWDDGSSSTQDGLVEFDESSQFDFVPGRGFWVLSRNPLEVSDTYSVVSLSETGNATIDLHSGWNIISNPLGNGPAGGDISWAAVQDENGISEPLFSYNGGFSQTSTFASAQNGEAFYFLNEQGLDELKIPYFGASSSSIAEEEESQVKSLVLSASKDGSTLSSVQLGLSPSAKKGEDRFDHVGPPRYFDGVRLQVQNEKIDTRYPLATDVRPSSTSGQSFDVTLTAEPGTEMVLRLEGLDQLNAAKEVRLYDASNAKTYDLRADQTIEVEPGAESSRFVLLLGDESYVSDKQSDLVPQKVTLHQNYPNPFRSQTTLKYALPEQSDVTIQVFDLLGRKVRTLARGSQEAGTHTIRWDARAQGGGSVASGTYLVRLRAGDQIRTMKVTLVK